MLYWRKRKRGTRQKKEYLSATKGMRVRLRTERFFFLVLFSFHFDIWTRAKWNACICEQIVMLHSFDTVLYMNEDRDKKNTNPICTNAQLNYIRIVDTKCTCPPHLKRITKARIFIVIEKQTHTLQHTRTECIWMWWWIPITLPLTPLICFCSLIWFHSISGNNENKTKQKNVLNRPAVTLSLSLFGDKNHYGTSVRMHTLPF